MQYETCQKLFFLSKNCFSALLRNILDTNRASRYKARTKIKRRHGNECTSYTFVACEFSLAPKFVSNWHPVHPWTF
ncbi:hypothetical protein HMPREF9195_00558 [Treponema medium ATCC 700293]|uniref:Uncharacterized protein n=1 Tax=Treponema medium ATCC 700293 TaxID=1125700 RepID=A0AA87THC2_TREMD|nr:hypothetical protein HMPREF9195_00558 [Treponema medium ATCC 700293]